MSVPPGFPFDEPLPVPAAITLETMERVRGVARRLVRRTVEARPAWVPPPFDPGHYASVLGLTVRIVPGERLRVGEGELDGLLLPGEPGWTVSLNACRSPARRRFTLAHEIAHTFFDPHMIMARSVGHPVPEPLERLCDVAAAELLMPEPWIGRAIRRGEITAATIVHVASVFHVSLEAAALRVLEALEVPAFAGLFGYGPRPRNSRPGKGPRHVAIGELAYRARRVFRSEGMPYVLPPGKSVPDSSVIYRCSLAGVQLEAEETFEAGKDSHRFFVSACPVGSPEAEGGPPMVIGLGCRMAGS